MLSANEEFQSTNEELETSKEELQSTNEELTTTIDELLAAGGFYAELYGIQSVEPVIQPVSYA